MPTWPTPGRQVVVHGIVRNYKGLGIEPEGAVEQVTCRLPPKGRDESEHTEQLTLARHLPRYYLAPNLLDPFEDQKAPPRYFYGPALVLIGC
ncbi:hypothetical protein FOWG_16680 [Fusarium oxysporum f. sp. lycopersici MN25]|uniref:Uncharacterized protein n=1 Tax=Fusarium oxysporum Fo47 TaxID=660027 RepID=W9KVU9_FUSOX|nr:hypothetical protein FOZG_02327 [Fusarium oxysporum Fo47]EWZ79165.1 hypothetical protein FOWG_16680 [Fusarium oxysporum f. sp. lycopersici MN25]